jgi:DNA-binding GntR family transcriptional regulator
MTLTEVTSRLQSAADLPRLSDLAYWRLREEILRGGFSTNEPIRQEKIAARLEISRLPVREALSRLEAEGLVTLRPRRGYVLTPHDPAEIEEIFDIRMILERRAGALAARARTRKDVEDVERLLSEMDGMTIGSADDAATFAVRNSRFHDRLFASSGRKRLCGMLLTLRGNVERYARLGAAMLGHLNHVHKDHRRIFAAFQRGDETRLADLCADHVQKAGERLIAMLKAELAKKSTEDK